MNLLYSGRQQLAFTPIVCQSDSVVVIQCRQRKGFLHLLAQLDIELSSPQESE
jgi:hypothetical protein